MKKTVDAHDPRELGIRGKRGSGLGQRIGAQAYLGWQCSGGAKAGFLPVLAPCRPCCTPEVANSRSSFWAEVRKRICAALARRHWRPAPPPQLWCLRREQCTEPRNPTAKELDLLPATSGVQRGVRAGRD